MADSTDPTLFWLWHRREAKAPNGPLACEPPYAANVALKNRQKKRKKKKNAYFPQP